MFSSRMLRSINSTLAVAMLVQPVLAAIPPEVVRAAPAEPAPQAAPEAAASEPLTATVPAPLLADDVPVSAAPVATQAQVEETLRSAPIMFIENDNMPTVSAQGKERPRKTFQVQGGAGSIWLAPDAIWVTLLEPPAEETIEEHLIHEPEAIQDAQARAKQPVKGVNLKVSFNGANPNPRIEGFDPLDTKVSFFKGNDPEQWRTDVPVWGGVRYTNLYPGIDLVVSSKDGDWDWKLEVNGKDGSASQSGLLPTVLGFTSFLTDPTPEPSPLDAVSLRIEGAEGLDVLSSGEFALQPALEITTNVGEYSLPLLDVIGADPQDLAASQPGITGNVIEEPFANPAAPKVMAQSTEGSLLYSTFLGGSGIFEFGYGIAVDELGAAYITGETDATDFPTILGSFQTAYGGGDCDAFVAKLSSDGSGLVYATYLGGLFADLGKAIALDNDGAAYITGAATSGFPTTLGVPYPTYSGGGQDVFITKLNATGTDLIYSTYLGAIRDELGLDITLGIDGAVYVTGRTNSASFPTTLGAYDTTYSGDSGFHGDAFVTKLTADGSSLGYSTFLGGSSGEFGNGIAVDSSGAAYITGYTYSSNFPITAGGGSFAGVEDAFVTKLNASGSAPVYSTYLGGNQGDRGYDIALGESGSVYVVGNTRSPNFPVTLGAYDTSVASLDAFVTRLGTDGTTLVYSTFFGGSGQDWGARVVMGANGEAYIVGHTDSSDLPVTADAIQPGFGGVADAFIARLSADGSSLKYSTFLGSIWDDKGWDIALGPDSGVYIAGYASSPSFPTTEGAYRRTLSGESDAFAAKLGTRNPATLIGATRRTGGGTDWPVDNLDKQTQATVGNPINTATGNQTYETTDLRLPTPAGDITFSRSYSSFNTYYDWQEAVPNEPVYEESSLGPGWLHHYETRLYFFPDADKIIMATPGGNRSLFKPVPENPDAYQADDGTAGRLVHDGATGRFTYTSSEGVELTFFDSDQGNLRGKLDTIDFQLDGTINLEYDPDSYRLAAVTDSNHTAGMTFGYSPVTLSGRTVYRLTSVSLSDGRSIALGYTVFSQPDQQSLYWSTNLTSMTDVRGQSWGYVYANSDTQPDLLYDANPYLRHFLVERRMPLAASSATIIRYRYEMIEGPANMPDVRSTGELDGAGQPTVSIKYESIPGTDNAPLIRYGVDLGGENFVGPYIRHEYDPQGRLVQMQTPGGLPGMPTWQTQYAVDPADPEKVIYQPASTIDPNGVTSNYTWTPDFLSMESIINGIKDPDYPDGVYGFYQFVSEEAGLHLPELIFYPYAAGGTPERIQTQLIYNTASVANPVGDYGPDMPANEIPARIPNPYTTYPGLSSRLLLGRIDDPEGPNGGFVTLYYYYDAGPRKGLVQCVDTPTPGGDTYYDYNGSRQPVDVYQGGACTSSGGHTGGLHTVITYDSLNRVETTTGPDGMVTRYEYIGQSDLVKIVTQHDNAGKGTLAEDTNGDAWNIKTAYFYDVAGRLMASIENYDPAYGGGALASVDLDGDGSAESFHIDPAAPHINRAMLYRYDAAGRVVEAVANYDGSDLSNAANYYEDGRYNFSTRTVYDGAGRAAAVIENYTPGSVGGAAPQPVDLDGDGEADLSLALSPDAPDLNRITINRYNALGRLKQVISPAWPSASGEPAPYQPHTTSGGQTVLYNRVTAYEYDNAGNVTKTIVNYDEGATGSLSLDVSLEPGALTSLGISSGVPDRNIATCTEYDILNRPVFSRAACVDDVGGYYAESGNIYNRVTYTAYDVLNRPIVVVDNYDGPAVPPLSGDITLTSTVERNHITRIYYDGLGRTEWVVRNMTGNTGRSIDQVLGGPDTGLPDYNLVTRAYYNELGQQIAQVENYRETFGGMGLLDLILTQTEIEVGLSQGYNHVTRTFYGADGLPSAVTDAFVGGITGSGSPPPFSPGQPDRNLTTYYQDYDDLNRPVQVSINRWDDHITNLVRYDNLGRVDWSVSDYDNQPRTTDVSYANLGFSVTTEDPSGRLVRTVADVRGNPSTTVAPGTLNLTVANSYDLFGRVTRSNDGVTAPVETTYDALGQAIKVTSADRVVTYTYNLLGQMVIARTQGTSDGACSATAYQYDNAGQLLRVVENYTNPGGCASDAVQFPKDVDTQYQYDAAGNLVSVVLANGSTRQYQVDALGQTIFEVLDPTGEQLFTRTCYDAAGSVTRTIRGSGQASAAAVPCDTTEPAYLVTAYRYDALGRPIEIDYEETGDPLTSAKDVTFAYDSFGSRKSMMETGGRTWTYTSTRDGLLESVNWEQGGTPGTPVSYEYDPAGNRTRLTVGNGTLLDTRYKLDDAGRLDCIDGNGNGSCDSADVDYGYNDASQVTQAALPNGVVSTYSYDPLGQLDAITHELAGSPIATFDYTPDGLGDRTLADEFLLSPRLGTAQAGFMQNGLALDESDAQSNPDTHGIPEPPDPTPDLPIEEPPSEEAAEAAIEAVQPLPGPVSIQQLIDTLDTAWKSGDICTKDVYTSLLAQAKKAQQLFDKDDNASAGDLQTLLVMIRKQAGECVELGAAHELIYQAGTLLLGSDEPAPAQAGGEATLSLAGPLVVNSTGDGADANPGDGLCDDGTGACTLRAAIREANSAAGPDTITFGIPGTGPYTIRPASVLPAISDPVVIDATTQPGYAGMPLVEIDGSQAGGGNGLTITAGGSTVRGLVINRFGGAGIYVTTSGGNVIQGNFIGTDITGTLNLGNEWSGVGIWGVSNNTIGGTAPGAGNVISGNGDPSEVWIFQGHSNLVQGNAIGTDMSGSLDIGDAFYGVDIWVGSNNTIGGNLIAYNDTDGVVITSLYGSGGTGNTVRGNAIFSNGSLGINLEGGGVIPNDVGDADIGANTLQNYPVLASATSDGASTLVMGSLNSSASTVFTLDFYASATCDASGYGEGQTYLGAGQATTDASGNAAFSITTSTASPDGWAITATATNPTGNTSEFSACVTVTSTGGGAPPQSDDPIFNDIDLPHDPTLGPMWDGESLTAGQVDAYHAEFGLDGISFVGLAGDQPLSAGARLWLSALRQGETQVDLPAPDPLTGNPNAVNGWLVQDNILLRQRLSDPGGIAGLFEIVSTRAQDIDLAYLLTAPPVSGGSGDLELVLGLDTTLEVVARQEGVYLIDESGNGIFIGQGTATDANGSSVPVAVEPDEAGLRLFIPEDWLAQAVYPILIDPPVAGYVYNPAAQSQTSYAWRYQYDGLGRLTYACSKWDGSKCTGRKFTYQYDEAGSLESFSRWNGKRMESVRFLIDDATNQVLCLDANKNGSCADDTPWVYDNLGNLTSDGVTTYTYDTANRLVKVVGPAGTTGYEYNGDGDRVAETHDGARTEFTLDVASSLTQVLAETTNGQTISYLYGLGLVGEMSAGQTEYHLTDTLGSVRQLAGGSGSVLLAQTFDPYGNRFEQARGSVLWDAASPFGWTGEQSDPNGLTYLRARYYAPSMGRFTQIDPFAGALALPASMNGYGYGHGNPVRYTDPSGEFPILIALAIIGAAALGTAAYGYQVHSNMQQGMDFWNAAYYQNINWGTVGGAAAIGAVAAPALYLGYLALPYAYVYATSTLPTYASYLYGANFVPTAFGLELTAATSLIGATYATYGAPLVNQVMPYIPPFAAASYIYAYESGWIPPEVHQDVMFTLMAGYESWVWEQSTAVLWEGWQAREAETAWQYEKLRVLEDVRYTALAQAGGEEGVISLEELNLGPKRLVVGGGRFPGFASLGPDDIALNSRLAHLPDVNGDINWAPFRANSFPEVYFERVPFQSFSGENIGALQEAYRVLHPGGTLRIITGRLAPWDEIEYALYQAGFTEVKIITRLAWEGPVTTEAIAVK